MNKKHQIIEGTPGCEMAQSPGPEFQGLPQFVGVKIIGATEMDMVSFKQEKGEPYEGENAPGYKVVYEDGYTSWSPKHVFEKAYSPVREFEPGIAIMFLNTETRNWRYAFNGENTGENPFGRIGEFKKTDNETRPMTWDDMCKFCETLNAEQRKQKMVLWREDEAISKIQVEILPEDHVMHEEVSDVGCFPVSELPKEIDIDECELAYKKGTPILWEDF